MHKSKSAANKYENKFGPDPQWAFCPFCNQGIQTQVKYSATASTHIIASILCALGCWLCFWIPYVLKNFNIARHFCPICVHHIGSFNPRTKIATSTLYRRPTTVAVPAYIKHTNPNLRKTRLKSKKNSPISVKISNPSKNLEPLKLPKKLKTHSQQTETEIPQKVFRDVSICTHMYKNVGTEMSVALSQPCRPKKCNSLSFGQYTQTCDHNLRKMSEKSLTANVPQFYEPRRNSRIELLLSKLISSEKFLRACSFGSSQINTTPPRKFIEHTEKATSTMKCFSSSIPVQKINSERVWKTNRKYRSKSDYSKYSEVLIPTIKPKNDLRRRPKSKITICRSDSEPKKNTTLSESKMFDLKVYDEISANEAEVTTAIHKVFQNKKLRFQNHSVLPKKTECREKMKKIKTSHKISEKVLSDKSNNDGGESSVVASENGLLVQEATMSDESNRISHFRGDMQRAYETSSLELLASFENRLKKPSRLKKPQTHQQPILYT